MCHSVRKPSSSHKLLPSKGRYHDAADVACLPLLLLQQSSYCGRSLSGHLHGHDLSSSISVNAARSFTHRRFYTQTLLHTKTFTRRSFLHTHTRFHTQTLLHTDAFTHRRFYTQKLLHTKAFTHRRFYTQTLLHADAFTRRCVLHTHTRFHTQTLLHTDAFTHRRFYTQTLLHADAFYTRTHAFTHKRFYTQTLLHTDTFTQTKASIAIFPQFLTSNVHFVRKGYD